MGTKLADAPRALAERTGRPAPAGAYGRLWRGIVDGRLPAQRAGQGWLLRDEDLPAAAAILGMTTAEVADAAEVAA